MLIWNLEYKTRLRTNVNVFIKNIYNVVFMAVNFKPHGEYNSRLFLFPLFLGGTIPLIILKSKEL